MTSLPAMIARAIDSENSLFANNNATCLDFQYNINFSNPQPHAFQPNSTFLSYMESFQRNNSYFNEVEEWSQLFQLLISWKDLFLVALFCTLIVITIIGNTLVILSVMTTRRLKTVTNCFVMSLAVADLLVGIFVMPPAVAVHLKGLWQLGWLLCDIWISLDVLLCTASILSLCAISVDRYLAVTQPLTYSRKRRSKRLALAMILIVWILALAITCPPMFGWYEPGRRDLSECRYNQNKGYVIFSAMGSFFIPMAVMIYVYARIYFVVATRHDHMTDINIHNKKPKRCTSSHDEANMDHNIFEQEIIQSQKTESVPRTLSNQTIANEVFESDENNMISKSGSCELAFCEQTLKRQPSLTSKNSTPIKQNNQFIGIQRQSLRQYTNTKTPCISDTYITRNTRVHHQKSLSNRISLLKKENKTTQTLSIVVGGFIACWLPFFIYYLVTPFLDEHGVSRTLTKVLTWLGWFNSAINPFIYAFYSTDFRAAFWRLTFKRFFRSSSKARFPSNTISVRR